MRYFHFCICFIFCNKFTVQYHGFEKQCHVMMSGDICREDWCLAFCRFVFKQLSNITNNNFYKVTFSINDNKSFASKCTTIYTVYCIHSGLLDAPCNKFQFFLFCVRSVWYKSNQCQMFLTKKSVGDFLPESLYIVRFDI